MSDREKENADGAVEKQKHFIREIIERDIKEGKHDGRVQTRFPPEPNGCLHIGHAKAVCLNFGMAEEYGGLCNLRFDDTNPVKEDIEFVDAIMEDIRWLGYDWGDRLFYASDYFEKLYELAMQMVRDGKAYVDDLSPEEIKEYRGTLTEPGKESPYRNRSIEENVDLFERMKNGEFNDGEKVLRAKIDMASPNMNMRDPALYRIKKTHHHRTGNKWCIYPMYDFAHSLSDSIEGITHSLCSIEFEDHRPLYDWCIEQVKTFPSNQFEFARLNLTYTVMSKRRLLQLVNDGHVEGWDDPRMPTLSGLRRRGYTPRTIRNFCERVGVAKRENMIDFALLEYTLREDLNKVALRRMAVLDPVKVVIENYPEDKEEELEAVNNPEDSSAGMRMVPFCRELYIERDDFREDPPKKFFRLAPGREVRLRYAYFVTCTDVVKNDKGEITEIRCVYDPATRGGDAPDGRKVKGTIHWVSARHALPVKVNIFEHLFTKENPMEVEEGKHFSDYINPESKKTIETVMVEPSLAEAKPGEFYQFERKGYFCADSEDSRPGTPVFNRTVTLRDSWAKIEEKNNKGPK